MTLHVQAEVFGTLALIPLALNMWASRKPKWDASYGGLLAASTILVIWGVTTTLERNLPPPEAYFYHWCMDIIACAGSALLAKTNRWRFAAVLAALYAFQIVANAAYLLAWKEQFGSDTTYVYKFVINTAFLGQLVAAGWPGGGRVASAVLAHWRHNGWQGSHVDAQR